METTDHGGTSSELVTRDEHGNLPDRFENPGLPPHRYRLADTDPKAAKNAERQVALLFGISILGTLLAIVSYFVFKPENTFASIKISNLTLGLGIGLSMLGIGLGAVHWAKTLMPDHEMTEMRHPMRGTDEDREKALEILQTGGAESGIGRRPLIRNTLLGALALSAVPGIVLLRDLGPLPKDSLTKTLWAKGVRLTRDPDGLPIKAGDVTMGSVFHVIPEDLDKAQHPLEEKAKAAVLLVRLDPEKVQKDPAREGWDVDGIYAYSKICTHVGCPVALYEQQTHHLLCPCHQSTFDVTQHCKVIFGPAKRPLPQLPIAIDSEGYLVAQSDFHEPVGPSYWERG
ncbi:MAG TPA: Rieske 2Fe-2S domain-containing protein [Actinomycetales bacterium]|nr:Rieske 2Fe-2S domain-containing protein [Actinomycetales bacterium]